MSIKSRMLYALEQTLFYGARKRGYRNLAWVVEWKVTYVCNLKCRYCCVPRSKEHGDTEKAAQRIIEMNPKHVIMTGGEPLLVPNIVSVAQNIRDKVRAYVMLTTNLMVDDEVACAILPYINQLHISIDGTGDYNKINRGVSGDRVLKKLETVTEKALALDKEYPITALVVLTPDNYMNASQLRESIHAIHPGIRVTFSTVEPIFSPLSLAQRSDILEHLIPELIEMESKYNVSVVGPLGNKATRLREADSLSAEEIVTCAQKPYYCPRQFFRVIMEPNGEITQCKTSLYIFLGIQMIRQAFRDRQMKAMMKHFLWLVDTLFIHPYDTYCPFPCKCEEFVDDIIMSKDGEPIPGEMFLIQGKFPEEELQATRKFIKAKFNPQWNRLVQEELSRRNTAE